MMSDDDDWSSWCRICEESTECKEVDETLREKIEAWENEFNEVKRKRHMKAALKAGFKSCEEYDEHKKRKRAARDAQYNQQLEEECARMGKTVEEYRAEQKKQDKNELPDQPDRPKCSCNEHPIPGFCASSLVEHRSSQHPVLISLFQAVQHQGLQQLNINEGDVSKRLPSEELEEYWQWMSDEKPKKRPAWFQGNQTLQCVAQERAINSPAPTEPQLSNSFQDEGSMDELMLDDLVEPVTPHSSPWSNDRSSNSYIQRTTVVNESDHPVMELVDDCQTPDYHVQHMAVDREPDHLTPGSMNKFRPAGFLVENMKSEDGISNQAITSSCIRPKRQHGPAERTKRNTKAKSVNETQQRRMLRPRTKGQVAMNSVQRAAARLPRRTRSHNSRKFYELGNDGNATSFRALW